MRTFRPTARTDGYETDDLFPKYDSIRSKRDKRMYLESEMVKMAKENTLFVTDILNQHERVWSECGEIILGHIWNGENRQAPAPVHPVLASYMVKIKSLNGEPIQWASNETGEGEPIQKGRASGDAMYYRVQAEWTTMDSLEADVPLPQAWVCLRSGGKYCRRASRSGLQEKYWKFEEVRPTPKQQDVDLSAIDHGKQKKQTFSQLNK